MRLSALMGAALAAVALAACSPSPTGLLSTLDLRADIVPDPGNSERLTYTFDEIQENCTLFVTTSGLYEDLAFPSPANLARCKTPNGTMGLMPSAFATGLVEIRVGLPKDASDVSIESYLFNPGDAPTLIAYDGDGAEIGRASDATRDAWATLDVPGGDTPITQIGLLMPQGVVYLDNLTVTYGSGTVEPPPPPDPEPGPGDPPTKDDCKNGGWEAWGFRNQGQCVRFIETGEDGR
jgi:hypothetical protein